MSQTITYTVPEMTCNHCRLAITGEVTMVRGVEDVDIDLENKLVKVSGDDLDDGALRDAIIAAGYEASR